MIGYKLKVTLTVTVTLTLTARRRQQYICFADTKIKKISTSFRCNNIVCEHTTIATKIGFDNQLTSCIARLNAKGETSI